MLPIKQVGAPLTLAAGVAGVAETADADTVLVINATATLVHFQATLTSVIASATTGMPIPPNSSLLLSVPESAGFWAADGVVTVVPVEVMMN